MLSEAEPWRFRLYAQREDRGEVIDLYLVATDDGLALSEPGAEQSPEPIPPTALPGIFARYGKPLEEGLDVTPLLAKQDAADEPLALELPSGQGATLVRFRFMPFGWVHPEDYLLWHVDGFEPVAAPAALVAHALRALARAYRPSG